MNYETYQYREAVGGKGIFFYTDCGNRMYSIKNDPMTYHKCLCPKCLMEGKHTILYLRGTEEAKRFKKADYKVKYQKEKKK